MYRLIYTIGVGENKREIVGKWVDRKQVSDSVKMAEQTPHVQSIKVEQIIDVTSDFYRP